MHYKSFFTVLMLVVSCLLFAQSPGGQPVHNNGTDGKPPVKQIRIVDTLTAQEKMNRNPVILQSELDSIIRQYNSIRDQQVINEPVKETTNNQDLFILSGVLVLILMTGFMIYQSFQQRKKINRAISGMKENVKQTEGVAGNNSIALVKEKNSKSKGGPLSTEGKISDLHDELNKLAKENEGLNRVIREYNGIQHDYDTLKNGILKTYKVKNYPGYDKAKDEALAMLGVFQTEKLVANYAYEKFVRPLLAITDQNKNSPAKISETEREQLLDLLVSMSLFYMEYLYLRVNDLSIGGRMVERIQGLSKNISPDISLLKKLNTEFGSRALVLKMALKKASLDRLSYPVFDETNLNI